MCFVEKPYLLQKNAENTSKATTRYNKLAKQIILFKKKKAGEK